MLDIQKVITQVQNKEQQLFFSSQNTQKLLRQDWDALCLQSDIQKKISSKKFGMLVPKFTESLASVYMLSEITTGYNILAVDGSQIYYDRHQGPACYVLNIGHVYFSYQYPHSVVKMGNEPFVCAVQDQQEKSVEVVDAQRELFEIQKLVELALECAIGSDGVCVFDGTIVWQGRYDEESDQLYMYFSYLEQLYQKNISYCGYISFPKSRELANILKLHKVGYQEDELTSLPAYFSGLADQDVVEIYLQKRQRTIIFEHCSPISYLYPAHLKPYFCYVHVGAEIVRVEVPAFIALDKQRLDNVCALVYDQAQKGAGYPVALFEAHEQAVIKQQDKMMFYHILYSMSQEQNQWYETSQKSIKKRVVSI